MMRFLLWLLAGVLLGGAIHIIVVLALPSLAEETLWTRLEAVEASSDGMTVLPAVAAGESNPLGLDPDLIYGLCRIDLREGPTYLRGLLPDAFWSVALVNPAGIVTYSTTNRDGIGRTLDLGIFNAAQTRLLAQQQLDVAEGVLVVESRSDDLFAVLRLAPPHRAVRERYAAELSQVSCSSDG